MEYNLNNLKINEIIIKIFLFINLYIYFIINN